MYEDRYLEYLESVPDAVRFCKETGKRPLFAYASNLDVLIKWDIDRFNRFLERYLKQPPSFQAGEPIQSAEDLARILCWFAIHGRGGEADIVSKEAVDALYEFFEMEDGLGGTCAQGAAALGRMGFPVLAHFTDCSKEVISRLDGDAVYSIKDGRPVPLKQCVCRDAPLKHFIVQYTKDDVIKACGRQYKVALSNRLIMGYDTVHKVLPLKEDFLAYCETHAAQICSYDISGFNAVTDKKVMAERLERLTEHYGRIKAENPDCKIYLESAHFISSEIRAYTYQKLAGSIDILGMNEEELVDLTRSRGREADKDSLPSVLDGLEELLGVYPVTGIVLHSKDYALYYGADMPGVDLEKGLTLGNLISGTRAGTGRYGTPEDCKKTLELALSSTGLAFAQELEQRKHRLCRKAVLVPSRYMEKPKTTIGLGDSFVAGMQICFTA